MKQRKNMENKITRKADLSLQEFCDMDQLYRLLDNWSKSSGMATMIVDKYGNQVSEDFGTTEFCRMVQSCETGKACCMATWKSDLDGIYECPFGFWDFSIPIVLPDGQALGQVLAGQALSTAQRDDEIMKKTAELGIDEKTAREVLSRVHRKTEKEMQGAYELLKETLHFFVQNSYSIWRTRNELKKGPAQKDRILSQITQIMYSYNLTVDLETETYSLITGTGMERTVEEYKKHNDYRELRGFQGSILHPSYLKVSRNLPILNRQGTIRQKTDTEGRLNTRFSIRGIPNMSGMKSMCLLSPRRMELGLPIFWDETSPKPIMPRRKMKRNFVRRLRKTRFCLS